MKVGTEINYILQNKQKQKKTLIAHIVILQVFLRMGWMGPSEIKPPLNAAYDSPYNHS